MTQLTLNLFGRIDVNITADPAIMNMLNRMFPEPTPEEDMKEPKPPAMTVPENYTVAVTGTPVKVAYDDEKCDSEETKEKEAKVKKQSKKDEPQVVWTDGPNNSKVQYREEGNNLYVKYHTGIVKTTWEKMQQIANLPVSMRKDPIQRVITKDGASWTSNKRVGLNAFTELLSTGAIVDTEGSLRRMLSSSARLNPDLLPNCEAALN